MQYENKDMGKSAKVKDDVDDDGNGDENDSFFSQVN